MHDFRGRELKIGDVLATTSLHYRDLCLVRVTGFTPKKICVEIIKSSNHIHRSGDLIMKTPEQVVLVSE